MDAVKSREESGGHCDLGRNIEGKKKKKRIRMIIRKWPEKM